MRYHACIDWLAKKKMQRILIYAIITFFLAACAHKIDIQQGNVISEEKLSLVQPGMERGQVRQLLGTPMLADPFHPDRWDYYYSMKPGRETPVRYRATLFFSNDHLLRIERKGPIPQKDAPQLPPER
jgi:outer membrane protein assembly factor BamE